MTVQIAHFAADIERYWPDWGSGSTPTVDLASYIPWTPSPGYGSGGLWQEIENSSITLNSPPLVAKIGANHRQPPTPAAIQASFSTDMYNRIWFLPVNAAYLYVDFGIILRDTVRYFIIWNAYISEDITCTSIYYEDDTQFEIFGPNGESPPWTLERLGLREYEAIAWELGLWEFRIAVTWTFAAPTYPSTRDGIFVGTRASLFPWAPLWKTMVEKLEWLTEVIETVNGKDQRIKLRQAPRRYISYKSHISTEKELSELEALHFQWGKRAWGVPLWGEAVLYTDPINSLDTTLTFDTRNATFKIGQPILIWQGKHNYDLNVITDIDLFTDLVSVDLEIENNYNGSCWIIPMVAGWMTSPMNVQITPDGTGLVEVEFACTTVEQLDTSYTPEATLPESTAGGADLLPVLNDPALARKGLKWNHNADIIPVDRATGKFALYSNSEYGKVVQEWGFRKETRESIWKFRELLHYMAGKWKPIWIPTHREDMTFWNVLGHGPGENVVLFNEVFIAKQYGFQPNRNALHFQMNDGTYHMHLITAMTETPGGLTEITLADILGVAVTPDNCVVSWLDKCTFAEDSVSLKWEAIDILECKAKVLRVEE